MELGTRDWRLETDSIVKEFSIRTRGTDLLCANDHDPTSTCRAVKPHGRARLGIHTINAILFLAKISLLSNSVDGRSLNQ